MTKDKILVTISDLHSGHKLGLLNPNTVLFDDEKLYSPQPTEAQKFLWELHEFARKEILDLAGKREIVIMYLGDLTNGDKYPEQLTSTRIADHVIIAIDCIRPWLESKKVTTIRLAFGTGAHEFGEASSVLLIENALKNEFKNKDIRAINHGLLNINGHTIDYAHHGPGVGIREWTNGNSVRFYLKNIIFREQKRKKAPPDLVLRGHVHELAYEVITSFEDLQLKQYKILIMPSMCMMSEHARQMTRSAYLITNGIFAFEINNKISDPIPFIEQTDVRIKEDL